MKADGLTNIESMLPHTGNMCLIDEVISFDEDTLHCQTNSHLKEVNPLKFSEQLTALAGIEYAGQAIALHRYLRQAQLSQDDRPKQGYLASVRQMEFFCDVLDEYAMPLDIFVKRVIIQDNKAIYDIKLESEQQLLIKGSLIVAEEI